MSDQIDNVPQDRDEELREQILVNKRRSGGDPSLLLDLLSELVFERETWKKRGEDGWSFLRFVQTPFDDGGLGWDRSEVENIVQFDHKYEKEGPQHDPSKAEEMTRLRSTVKDLLNPEAGPEKGNEYSDDSAVDNINSNDGGTSESYALRRLKRDHPELAEKVVADEMSANAAAIEAGFRDKTATIPIHKGGEEQHERAAERLAKHFDDVETLIRHLQNHA
jgi:hypothetical protein